MSIQTKNDHKKNAKDWLDLLSQSDCETPQYQNFVRDELHRGGWTLEDIGSSEEKLSELVSLAHKNQAIHWLDLLSQSGCRSPIYANSVRDSLKKGGWTLEDIGSSEEKLAELVRLANKNLLI